MVHVAEGSGNFLLLNTQAPPCGSGRYKDAVCFPSVFADAAQATRRGRHRVERKWLWMHWSK